MANNRVGAIVEDGTEIVSQVIGDKALRSTAADGTALEVNSTTGKMTIKDRGSALGNGVQRADMSKFAGTWIQGDLTASDTAAGIFELTNSYGTDLVVKNVTIVVTTVASGACTIDVGQTGTATTSSDTLIDGLDVNAATGAFDNQSDPGSNGKQTILWPSGTYLSASTATGTTSGLVGKYGVYVVDLN